VTDGQTDGRTDSLSTTKTALTHSVARVKGDPMLPLSAVCALLDISFDPFTRRISTETMKLSFKGKLSHKHLSDVIMADVWLVQ